MDQTVGVTLSLRRQIWDGLLRRCILDSRSVGIALAQVFNRLMGLGLQQSLDQGVERRERHVKAARGMVGANTLIPELETEA